MNICNTLLLCVCVCVSGFAQTSFALPIVQKAACINNNEDECATGVTGVDVLGTLYDVIFSQLSYDSLFAIDAPTFFGDESGANAAIAALVPALNVAGISGVLGDPISTSVSAMLVPNSILAVPAILVRSSNALYVDGSDFEPWGYTDAYLNVNLSISNPMSYNAYAVFTPSAAEAPAPPILALFGLGLVGISLSRRKRSLPG
jgi:hypothetical protein